MVDAVVLGMIFGDGINDGFAVTVDIWACNRIPVFSQCIRQVYHIARLTLLEQGGIALGSNLRNLPGHGGQLHAVFAGDGVGPYLNAVAGGVHAGLVVSLLAVTMLELLVALGQRRTGVVIDQPRGVVALQLHHHLQVVAQVVARQGVVQRQVALVLAACHTTYEGYTRLVV